MTEYTDDQRLSLLLDEAKKHGATAADAGLGRSVTLSVGQRLGVLETLERAESAAIGLRVLVGQQQASITSSDLNEAALRDLAARAVAMARAVPEDPYIGLAAPDQLAVTIPDVDACDPDEPSAAALRDAVAAAEDAARAVPGITNSEGAEAGYSRTIMRFAGTNGLSRVTERSGSSLSVSVLAGDNDTGMERDYDYDSAVYWADLRAPHTIGTEAAERTVKRLGGTQERTGTFPVVFDPRVARSLLGHLSSAINGASVARGTSFLKDMLGKPVFAPGITITEDPHRPRGLRSRPVDGEGLATHRRALIEDGVLTTWLLDLRSAKKLAMEPTGHAVRGLGGSPSPGASNLWLEPGTRAPAAMISAITQGFYVTELIGHGVNGVTGDYSRGAAGYWIKNGTLAHPVTEMTIAGNLKTMFARLEPASDLTIRYGSDSPTVLIDGMTVAGA